MDSAIGIRRAWGSAKPHRVPSHSGKGIELYSAALVAAAESPFSGLDGDTGNRDVEVGGICHSDGPDGPSAALWARGAPSGAHCKQSFVPERIRDPCKTCSGPITGASSTEVHDCPFPPTAFPVRLVLPLSSHKPKQPKSANCISAIHPASCWLDPAGQCLDLAIRVERSREPGTWSAADQQ